MLTEFSIVPREPCAATH